MLIRFRAAPALLACALVACLAVPGRAQTVDDGRLVARHELLTGTVYTNDTWDQYWEGPLKRTNGNIGRITTRTSALWANYGLTERLNIIGQVPYVWTNASQGVLHGIQGLQDLSVAAKYQVLNASPGRGALRAFAVVAAGTPLANYNPELLPLSIGLGSTNLSTRGTLNFHSGSGWFVNGSAAYTWRSQVELDRPYYFTNDEFVMSNEVDMPNAVDYSASAGWMTRRLMLAGFVAQQRTRGGGDIRRQDMPFISNRMNASKAGGMVMLPLFAGLEVQGAAAYTFDGRNVGQATTITAGLLYRFNRVSE